MNKFETDRYRVSLAIRELQTSSKNNYRIDSIPTYLGFTFTDDLELTSDLSSAYSS